MVLFVVGLCLEWCRPCVFPLPVGSVNEYMDLWSVDVVVSLGCFSLVGCFLGARPCSTSSPSFFFSHYATQSPLCWIPGIACVMFSLPDSVSLAGGYVEWSCFFLAPLPLLLPRRVPYVTTTSTSLAAVCSTRQLKPKYRLHQTQLQFTASHRRTQTKGKGNRSP